MEMIALIREEWIGEFDYREMEYEILGIFANEEAAMQHIIKRTYSVGEGKDSVVIRVKGGNYKMVQVSVGV